MATKKKRKKPSEFRQGLNGKIAITRAVIKHQQKRLAKLIAQRKRLHWL